MMPFVAVLDYGIGNLRSAQKALNRQGATAELTSDPKKIRKADGIVLPGVGHFGACMKALVEQKLDVAIYEALEADKPFLAICVGMQMLYESSEEAPSVSGLGILEGEIVSLPVADVRIPQIQWNQIKLKAHHPVTEGLDDSWMYFVHSYAPPLDDSCIASVVYGQEFPAAVAKDSVIATQFHPEKSGEAGLKLIANFVEILGGRK